MGAKRPTSVVLVFPRMLCLYMSESFQPLCGFETRHLGAVGIVVVPDITSEQGLSGPLAASVLVFLKLASCSSVRSESMPGQRADGRAEVQLCEPGEQLSEHEDAPPDPGPPVGRLLHRLRPHWPQDFHSEYMKTGLAWPFWSSLVCSFVKAL